MSSEFCASDSKEKIIESLFGTAEDRVIDKAVHDFFVRESRGGSVQQFQWTDNLPSDVKLHVAVGDQIQFAYTSGLSRHTVKRLRPQDPEHVEFCMVLTPSVDKAGDSRSIACLASAVRFVVQLNGAVRRPVTFLALPAFGNQTGGHEFAEHDFAKMMAAEITTLCEDIDENGELIGDEVSIMSLTPVYQEEIDFYESNGASALFKQMGDAGLSHPLRWKRPNSLSTR